jgi:hypothetical protein
MEQFDWIDIWVPDSWCWKGDSSPLAGKKMHLKIDSDGKVKDCIVPNGSIIGIEKPELDAVVWKFSPEEIKSRMIPPHWYKKESE